MVSLFDDTRVTIYYHMSIVQATGLLLLYCMVKPFNESVMCSLRSKLNSATPANLATPASRQKFWFEIVSNYEIKRFTLDAYNDCPGNPYCRGRLSTAYLVWLFCNCKINSFFSIESNRSELVSIRMSLQHNIFNSNRNSRQAQTCIMETRIITSAKF